MTSFHPFHWRTSDARSVDADPPAPGELVSIVIPCYNQAHFLAEAIESGLAQTHGWIDIVVVNDGSTDATEAIVRRYPEVTYLAQPNRGLAAARNAGLAATSGRFVIFLDADDRLLPCAAEIGLRMFARHPESGFVAGRSRFVSGEGRRLPTRQPDRATCDPYAALLRRNFIRNPAMVMFRRSVLDAMGGFRSGVDACADYDVYLRITRQYPVHFHNDVVAEYRKHADNMSLDPGMMLSQVLSVMRSERSFIRRDTKYRAAYLAGVESKREYYGDQLVTRMRWEMRKERRWYRLLADAVLLVRHHPRGAARHLLRKVGISVAPSAWRPRRRLGTA
jgi:glycosyltransferase involved in cell wall biosynthesis